MAGHKKSQLIMQFRIYVLDVFYSTSAEKDHFMPKTLLNLCVDMRERFDPVIQYTLKPASLFAKSDQSHFKGFGFLRVHGLFIYSIRSSLMSA